MMRFFVERLDARCITPATKNVAIGYNFVSYDRGTR